MLLPRPQGELRGTKVEHRSLWCQYWEGLTVLKQWMATSLSTRDLAGPRQHQRDIVWLFLVADPVVYGGRDQLTDLRQG